VNIKKPNKLLFKLPESHPARRFLEAFISCRLGCVGKEISWNGNPEIDQEWYSSTDERVRRFSEIMYGFVSYDIVLDGWLTDAPKLTYLEERADQKWKHLRLLLSECGETARAEGNAAVLAMVDQVRGMVDLWDAQLLARRKRISELGQRGLNE
jgi:hypothetical protein